MPRCLLALGAIATLLCLASCQLMVGNPNSLSDYSTNLDRSIDATGVRTLTLKTGSGRVVVISEDNLKTIEIEGALGTQAANLPEAKRIAAEVKLIGQSENTENPVVQVTEPQLGRRGQSYYLDLKVRVPKSVLVAIENTSSDIEVSALGSGLRVQSVSGLIQIEGVSGGTEVRTDGISTRIKDSSGRITVHDGRGDLEIQGITGDVFVQDTDGKLIIRHVSGNVDARDNPTGATVQNIDGDVFLANIENATLQGIMGRLNPPRQSP